MGSLIDGESTLKTFLLRGTKREEVERKQAEIDAKTRVEAHERARVHDGRVEPRPACIRRIADEPEGLLAGRRGGRTNCQAAA